MKLLLLLILVLWPSMAVAGEKGILVMAHGGGPDWNRAVEQVIEPLRTHQPVELALGMAERESLQAAVDRLRNRGVRQVAVVRMFVSPDSFLHDTEVLFGLRPAGPTDPLPLRLGPGLSVRLSRGGLMDSPVVGEILRDRVLQHSGRGPGRERVLLLAHGPESDLENDRWLAAMRARVESVPEFRTMQIRCETLREDWPGRRLEAEARIRAYVEEGDRLGQTVIVVPFRVWGFGPYHEVLAGLRYTATEGLCPHPAVSRWIEESARECFTAAWPAPGPRCGARP